MTTWKKVNEEAPTGVPLIGLYRDNRVGAVTKTKDGWVPNEPLKWMEMPNPGCLNELCVCKRIPDKTRRDYLVANAMELASDIHHAPGMPGWTDKPHRYVYDATEIIRSQAHVIEELEAILKLSAEHMKIPYAIGNDVDVLIPENGQWTRGTVVSVDNTYDGHRVSTKLYYNGQTVSVWLRSASHKIRLSK